MSLHPIHCLAVAGLLLGLGCDRNLEPFDPNESSKAPDMGHIFPEGAQQGPGLRRPVGMETSPDPARGIPPAAPQAAAGETIRGRVSLGPDLAEGITGQGVLFVIARSGGATAGPPLAVVRIPGPSFPIDFEIGQANVMIPGMRFEGPISVTARLDADGNAMTRAPGDVQGSAPGMVEPGSQVEILLDQPL